MGFLSRQPTPNEPTTEQWDYGPQGMHDDFSAMLNGLALRCKSCKRVTIKRFISHDMCPECNQKLGVTSNH